MGSDFSSFCEESTQEIQWGSFSSKDLYLEVTSSTFIPNKEICKKVCQNCVKSQILSQIMKKIFAAWDEDYLAANLLHLLKHFFLFVFSEKIPYSFLYEDVKKPTTGQYESSFHRLVPCNFTFQGQHKTVYISIAQTGDFDKEKEQTHMIETIISHFPEVNEYLLGHDEKIYLSDDNGKVVGIEEIYKHYSTESSDELVDPFQTKTKHFTVFRASIKTMECDLASPISVFLKQLVEKLLETTQQSSVIKIHAALEVLLSLMASHLYWLEKPIGRICYSLFKPSPTIDILMNLPMETSQMLSRVLLEYACNAWKPLVKPSLFSFFLSSSLDIRLQEIMHKTPQQALQLLLLLNSSGHLPNPFRMHSWEMHWETVSKFCLLQLKTLPGLMLFTELLMRNPSFYNHILSLSDPEAFLEPLLGELYVLEKTPCRTQLILLLLLILSKDKIFIKFINKDVVLSAVSWLKEYHIEKISLGSLMFLSLTRVFRENIRSGKLDYLHVITTGCLFNISTSLVGLHELPSMEYLQLTKALYAKYMKLQYKDTSEKALFYDLVQLNLEILCKILSTGLSSNPYLVQTVLHYSELFAKLKNSELTNKNITAICECIETCMKSLDTDNIQASILHVSKLYHFPPVVSEILPCKEFTFIENPEKWEEFVVPYLWMDITAGNMPVPNISRVMLFRHN